MYSCRMGMAETGSMPPTPGGGMEMLDETLK